MTGKFIVYYHAPGQFKGRGEFLRLMLEDAGVPYENTPDKLYGQGAWMDMFRPSAEAILQATDGGSDDDAPYPCLFPPAIFHQPQEADADPVFVNQVGACMIYLGDVLGYAPETPEQRARANQTLLNAQDYIAEGRRTFHPVKDTMSYKDQKEEGDRCSKEFTKERMLKYLYHFEKVVKVHGAEAPVTGTSKVTYADFALFHVLDATVAQFNTEYYDYAWDKANVPNLKGYHGWFKNRPKLKEYFASTRCMPWAGDSMM